ncbi:hypothetical protein K458DRAFT_462983 [Lentithecium fluviatile CBS 122367]|uniref:Uncharacterized protein n=1 Tax=Lentithecium fluviatile CBS 122367 TaxID=1168545 RepID=A0A6G1JI29_9PLEO|nr:hypothetical protein K458DRAFT_462983 [Lentithecium fluviatile CBS 122367]
MLYDSDGESTLAKMPSFTSKKETTRVFDAIRRVRRSKLWKKASIIVVVRDGSRSPLQAKCNEFGKGQLSLRGKPPICVTSDTQLHAGVNQATRDPKCSSIWVIVVSGLIPEIYFDIDEDIHGLRIVRVNKVDPEGHLLIDGASRWNGTRLDEWPKGGRGRGLTLGQNVSICPSDLGSGSWSSASSDRFSDEKREQIRSYVRQMSEQPMEGAWWDGMKGPVAALAAISGLAVGTFKASAGLTCNAKGIFFSFKCGSMALQAGGFTFKLAAALKLAAPPVAVGFGTGFGQCFRTGAVSSRGANPGIIG